ncbi:MAG: DNA repair and recombination protein RadA [Candidatus Helarchaeota archaeon]
MASKSAKTNVEETLDLEKELFSEEELEEMEAEAKPKAKKTKKTSKTKKAKKKKTKASEKEKSSEEEVLEKKEVLEEKEEEVKYKLTDLTGVGPAIADKLTECGIESLEAIAVASPNQLAAQTAIGEATCSKIIQSAREKLKIGFITSAQLLEQRKAMDRFTTGSEQLDQLLGGGVETRVIIEVYGEFRTGKTQIAHQLCVTVQLPKENGGLNASALYIDAEGTFRPERILEIAGKYPELDPGQVLENVLYARSYNSDHQTLILDKIPPLIKSKNIKLIVVDSVISHFRAEYVGRGTLSDRQQKLNKFIHKLLQLAEAHNLTVYITNQVMASPGLFFGDPTTPVGGHVLAHASTYRLYLRKSKGMKRVVRMVDSPCLPEGETVIEIYEHGIKDG